MCEFSVGEMQQLIRKVLKFWQFYDKNFTTSNAHYLISAPRTSLSLALSRSLSLSRFVYVFPPQVKCASVAS